MTLRDMMQDDADSVFLNTDEFAESVTYNGTRTINAVVQREQLQTVSQDTDTVAPVFYVHVANSASTGISSQELDLGGDTLSFPPRDGKAAETKYIQQLITQDEAMLVLEVR